MSTINPGHGLAPSDFRGNRYDTIEAIREILINDDWLPADAIDTLECDEKDLEWVERYGWDAYKPLDRDDAERGRPSHLRKVLLCRFDDGEIRVTVSTRNYVIDTEVTISNTSMGATLLAALLAGINAAA